MKQNTPRNFRRFVLFRKEDTSGISGTGVVAEGIQFSNGKCVISWISDTPSVEIYDSIDEINRVHGHQGRTVIQWTDDKA